MKLPFVPLIFALFAVLTPADKAGAQSSRPLLVSPLQHTGLTISLTTSGYRFDNSIAQTSGSSGSLPVTPHWRGRLAGSTKFTAAVALVNHSKNNIEFEFPTSVDADEHFLFRILDSTESVLWQSDAEPGVNTLALQQQVAHDTLTAHSAWRLQASVPLVISGQPLPAGRYVLEARTTGTPQFSATATFEVAQNAATSGTGGTSTNDQSGAETSYEGILSTGIMAIGGETTGVILKTKNSGTYELDLGKDSGLRQAAQALNGKSVVVVGTYKPCAGVEIRERRIIEVKSLSAGTK